MEDVVRCGVWGVLMSVFFFFQAEDGIRGRTVTGVQTCALPICSTNLVDVLNYAEQVTKKGFVFMDTPGYDPVAATGQVAGGANLVCFTTGRGSVFGRSEERRVGKEWRSRWAASP